MDKENYEKLLKKIKVFEKNIVNLPGIGEQTKHNLTHIIDKSEKFKLIINKKGHRNSENLTIILNSITHKCSMVRFDVNGSDHANPPNNERIPTPHIHIFTDEYMNGGIAIPLHELDDYLIETADFCVYVNNDSCEPAIKSETYAFVRRTNEIRNGLIALVIYNETLLIKRIEILGDEINLISLNPKYETIKVEPHNQFKLIGKIVQ